MCQLEFQLENAFGIIEMLQKIINEKDKTIESFQIQLAQNRKENNIFRIVDELKRMEKIILTREKEI